MIFIRKMESGIDLTIIPLKGTRAVTLMAIFPVGSRYETKNISGASHFVEHMMFKGTAKRPTNLHISRELDALGAGFNAFTFKDYTGYFVKINGSKQEVAFDILSDMIFHSSFDEKEVEKEKGVIAEEIKMYDDNPTLAVDLLSDKALFGDHPLGWNIAGTKDSVFGMTRDNLWQYYQSAYKLNNMVVVVAGDTNVKTVNKLMRYFCCEKKAIGDFNKNKYIKSVWLKNIDVNERVKAKQKEVDQAHIIFGFPGLKNNDPLRYAGTVLLNVLGGSMSSRLFVEVREKRGLAYMVRSGGFSHRDVGAVQIQAGLDPKRLKEAIGVVKSELLKIASEPISSNELNEAKSNLAGRTILSMEDSSAQAEWYAKQAVFNLKFETPEQALKKIKHVTKNDVRCLAKKFFQWDHLRLAVVSPLAKNEIIKMLD